VRTLVLLTLLALVTPVAAEPAAPTGDLAAYEVEGDADATGSDPRVAALDEAFGRAVGLAVKDLVDAEARKANKTALDKEIVGRARLWVARFTVNKDETSDGRRQLSVTVRVDRDKMRARLGELKIPVVGLQAPVTPPPEQAGGEKGGPPPAIGRGAVVLLRVMGGDGTHASFGPTADKDAPGLGALAATLRTAGYAIRRSPASGTVRPDGDLPIGDGDAEGLANEAKAEAAAVASVTIGGAIIVRGVATTALLVGARVRIVEKGKKLGEGVAVAAARGSEPAVVAAAIDRALVAAATDALPNASAPRPIAGGGPPFSPPAPGGFTGADTPIPEPGVVLVRLPPKTPWGLVAAELKYLAGAKGITRAVLRRMSPAGWVIGVSTTESVQRIAQIAKRAPGNDSTANVKVVGDIVELALGGAP
jgi:hypothetical protein